MTDINFTEIGWKMDNKLEALKLAIPERRVFYIDVGDISTEKVDAALQAQKFSTQEIIETARVYEEYLNGIPYHQTKVKETSNVQLTTKNLAILECMKAFDKVIIKKARQVGGTTLLIEYAKYHRQHFLSSNINIVAANRSSADHIQTCLDADDIDYDVKIHTFIKTPLFGQFNLTKDTVLLIDELSFLPFSDTNTWYALLHNTPAKVIIVSSTTERHDYNKDQGLFNKIWYEANDYLKIVHTTANPINDLHENNPKP